ncbi:pyrophosphate-energized vacuolar membrane proton pump-like, partial [Ananas comosus]
MGGTILTDLAAEILIPAAAAVGIAYALVQWILVARVRLSPENEAPWPQRGSGDGVVGGDKNGYDDFLIEEEEGINNRDVVIKCAEIQSAISE